MFCVCDGVPMVNLQLMIMKLFLKPRPHLLPLVRTLKDGSKEVLLLYYALSTLSLIPPSLLSSLIYYALSSLSRPVQGGAALTLSGRCSWLHWWCHLRSALTMRSYSLLLYSLLSL